MEKKEFNYDENYDEISLMDLINILLKRKWLVVLCLSFAVLISFCYLFFKKPIYESKAVIQVGYNFEGISRKVQSLEDPMSLVWVLKNTEMLSSVKLEKMDKYNLDIITLATRNGDPYKAQAFLKNTTDNLIKRHNALFNQILAAKQNQLNLLKNQLQSVRTQVELFEKKLPRITNDNTNNMLLLLEKEKLVEKQLELEKEISEQEALFSENYIRPTRLLKEPTLPLKPIGRNKIFYLGLGAILGVMMGIMLALSVEYIQSHIASGSQKNSSVSQ